MKATSTVVIRNRKYSVNIEGDGPRTCLCIGIGSLMQRTLSENFKSYFTVYSCDLYFAESTLPASFDSLTMTDLAQDLLEIIQQLNLKPTFLVGHSCFGILALETAKQLNAPIAGVILVASAPEWTQSSLAFTNHYFLEHAEPGRVLNDQERKAHYNAIRKPTDSEVSIEKYISDSARYWGHYEISEELIYKLWEGITANDEAINHYFEKILPNYQLSNQIENISCPVILLAGDRDFDSLPLVQWQSYPKPKQFQMIDCGPIGHWPNLEAPEKFDQAIHQWLEEYC